MDGLLFSTPYGIKWGSKLIVLLSGIKAHVSSFCNMVNLAIARRLL